MADFFEGLEKGMGSEGFKVYAKTLMKYLEGYGYFLQWTCKQMARIPLGNSWILSGYLCSCGDLRMLEYLETFRELDSYMYPRTIETTKWTISRGLIDIASTFRLAVSTNNYELVDYFIKKGYQADQVYWSANNVKMLKKLWKAKVVDTVSVWNNGGFLSVTDELVLWFICYQHVNIFNYEKIAEITQFSRLVDYLAFLAFSSVGAPRLKIYGAIKFICNGIFNTHEDEKLPLLVCKQLPYMFAICIDSDNCVCDDPNNHEERERDLKRIHC
jgi:hypothetical protein